MKWLALSLVAAIAAGLLFAGVGWWGHKQAERDRVASATNLRQWGIALNLYLTDNNNQLPEVGMAPIEEDQLSAWYNQLPPYISLRPLAELPPGERPRPGDGGPWTHPAIPAPRVWDESLFPFHYAMNRSLQPEQGVRSFRIYEIDFPHEVVFLAEVNGFQPAAGPDDLVFHHAKNQPDDPANVLMCDGHVKKAPRWSLQGGPEPSGDTSPGECAHRISWFSGPE